MHPCGTGSSEGSNSSSSSALNSFLMNLRVEINRMSRRSADKAERSAGIARVSDLRTLGLDALYEITIRSRLKVKIAYSGICSAE